MRNVTGAVLAVLGAAATLFSPWLNWYAGRHGSTYKFWDVFGSGITPSRSGIMDSVFLVFLVTAILTVLGVMARSRALVLLAGVVALAFTTLWLVRQGNQAGQLVLTGNGTGVGLGVALALGGSAAMLLGGLLMAGRREVVVERPVRGRGRGRGRLWGRDRTAPPASTRAYDTGRADADAATGHVTTSSGARWTPEEQAEIDRMDEEPPRE